MRTRITINQEAKSEIEYPVAMMLDTKESREQNRELVVLFRAITTGTVLYSSNTNWDVGDYSEMFAKADDRKVWKPFEGSIHFSYS